MTNQASTHGLKHGPNHKQPRQVHHQIERSLWFWRYTPASEPSKRYHGCPFQTSLVEASQQAAQGSA